MLVGLQSEIVACVPLNVTEPLRKISIPKFSPVMLPTMPEDCDSTVMVGGRAGVTVRFVELLTKPDVAVMVLFPGAIADASPKLQSTRATVESGELQITELVTSCVLPSV